MRTFALALIGASCALTAAGAQEPQLTFKSRVTVVSVDATVLDKDDRPVAGLTAADFDVKLNGKLQPVRALTYIRAAGAADPVANAATVTSDRVTTNDASAGGEPRTFVVLVDDLSINALNSKSMFYAGSRFVEKLPTADLIGLTTTSGTVQPVNPSANRDAIVAALKHVAGDYVDTRAIAGQGHVTIAEALNFDLGDNSALKSAVARECGLAPTTRLETAIADSPCVSNLARTARIVAGLTKMTTARQLAALEAVIKAMSSAAGIKHIVLLTAGLGVTRDLTGLDVIAKATAAAGVHLSVLFDGPDAEAGGILSDKVMREDNQTLGGGMQTLADISGGSFYRVIGQADRFFDRVMTASSGFYRLGVEEPPGAIPGKDFTVSAKVRRQGLTVHANRTAISTTAAAPAPSVPLDVQLRAAISTDSTQYRVPIALGTALRRGARPGTIDIAVNVVIPASVGGPLTTMFGLVDDKGVMQTGRKVIASAADPDAFRLTFSVPVQPGAYRLRFAAGDAMDAVGSVESTVVARLRTIGPFTASDLLTSWVGADGQRQFLGLTDVPAAVKAVSTTLELYPLSEEPAPMGVRVSLALSSALGKGAPLVERVIEPIAAAGVLRADADLPIDQLEPGLYAIRATVTVADRTVGSTSVTIRKR